jgi:hypothetical protein
VGHDKKGQKVKEYRLLDGRDVEKGGEGTFRIIAIDKVIRKT